MHSPNSELVLDPALIRKYDAGGPRYTSYPTADRFVDDFGEPALRSWLERRNIGAIAQPLSVYVHLPFCATLCYYCGCNKIVTRDRASSAKYIKYLDKELALLGDALSALQPIAQMHWGGGTPTFLSFEEMASLMRSLDARFPREPRAETSIEVDPRYCEPGRMAFLNDLGFNRASLGVQDFDPDVQQAVHRIQSEDETRRVAEEARAAGFRSINFDLIYGLPRQTPERFGVTLERVIDLAPDRIALYSYAHLPTLFKPQRRIHNHELPSAEAKLRILSLAIERLTEAGYQYIGMDHFAQADDDLAIAQRQGRLQRNFQGYSTLPEADLIGVGVSAIGRVGPTYYQNTKSLDDYYSMLEQGALPVQRGIELTADDLLRRAVIHALMCQFRVSIESIELAHLVDFRRAFADELEDLRQFEQDGLIEVGREWITVTPRGRLLVRAICMVFDRYLRERERRASYSRVI